jgi:hypothetical protein
LGPLSEHRSRSGAVGLYRTRLRRGIASRQDFGRGQRYHSAPGPGLPDGLRQVEGSEIPSGDRSLSGISDPVTCGPDLETSPFRRQFPFRNSVPNRLAPYRACRSVRGKSTGWKIYLLSRTGVPSSALVFEGLLPERPSVLKGPLRSGDLSPIRIPWLWREICFCGIAPSQASHPTSPLPPVRRLSPWWISSLTELISSPRIAPLRFYHPGSGRFPHRRQFQFGVFTSHWRSACFQGFLPS